MGARRPGRLRIVVASVAALALGACSQNAETNRSQFAVVPDETLAQLSDGAWEDLLEKAPVLDDPEAQARLERVGSAVTAASGRSDIPWSFAVLDRPEVNALVLPNGRVGVFRGLMALAHDDDELGAVLAHEVAHILARHPSERVSQQLAAGAAVGILRALVQGEENEHADEVGAALGAGAVYGVLLPYSRGHELEADRLGVGLMRKAGLDPHGAIRIFERMSEVTASRPKPPEVLSTHPTDARRIEALKALVAAGAGQSPSGL